MGMKVWVCVCVGNEGVYVCVGVKVWVGVGVESEGLCGWVGVGVLGVKVWVWVCCKALSHCVYMLGRCAGSVPQD